MIKLTKLDRRILAAYDRIEAADPDISTERLLAMTADECGVDYSDVVDVLAMQAERAP